MVGTVKDATGMHKSLQRPERLSVALLVARSGAGWSVLHQRFRPLAPFDGIVW